jgi:CRISPR-associated endonuclease Csn1
MDIREDLTLGIDLGIGSCGWAVIRRSGGNGEIVDWGARTFDVPETDKKRTPTNQIRREKRGLRKVLRRRRQRMNEIRRIFKSSGLLEHDGKTALSIAGLDPWRLRAEGLDRRLTGKELAVSLAHIAKHRGFKSNSKRKSNEASDDSKMLKAIHDTIDKLGAYRTVGEMFAKDELFAVRKRNRDGDYSRSVLRDDQEREVRLLFDRQRRMGNELASSELEDGFIGTAFFQRRSCPLTWCRSGLRS